MDLLCSSLCTFANNCGIAITGITVVCGFDGSFRAACLNFLPGVVAGMVGVFVGPNMFSISETAGARNGVRGCGGGTGVPGKS